MAGCHASLHAGGVRDPKLSVKGQYYEGNRCGRGCLPYGNLRSGLEIC